MGAYRLYCLDDHGGISYADWIEAHDDVDAVRKAHDLKQHAKKCEVWQGERLVATLDAQDLV